VHARIILKKEQSKEGRGVSLSGKEQGKVAKCCKYEDKRAGLIKCGENLDKKRNCQLLLDSATLG